VLLIYSKLEELRSESMFYWIKRFPVAERMIFPPLFVCRPSPPWHGEHLLALRY